MLKIFPRFVSEHNFESIDLIETNAQGVIAPITVAKMINLCFKKEYFNVIINYPDTFAKIFVESR